MIHKLKTKQPFFDDVFYNRKDFEVRKNDRDYKIGDRLQLLEFPFEKRQKYVLKDIKYILEGGQYGIAEGYVVLGLKEIGTVKGVNMSGDFISEVIKKANNPNNTENRKIITKNNNNFTL